MAIMPDSWIRRMAREEGMIEPYVESQRREGVISYGVSSYGYDARVAEEFKIFTNVDNALVDPKAFSEQSFVERQTDATQGALRVSVVDEGSEGLEVRGVARAAVEEEDGGLVAREREGDEVVLEGEGGADEALAGAQISIGRRDGDLRGHAGHDAEAERGEAVRDGGNGGGLRRG